MFVAAMVDALPELREPILAELAAVRPSDARLPEFHEGLSGGVRARRFGLPGAAHDVAHAAVHEHPVAYAASGEAAERGKPPPVILRHRGEAGTLLPDLRQKLVDAPLSASTRRHALALLQLVGEAEARVHGVPVEQVHFHELADWDSVMDFVATGCIAARLEGAAWTASVPPLGRGTTRTAHGRLPVPTPATAYLLAGFPLRDDGFSGERVTPTGAAILRYLVGPARCGAGPSAGRLRTIGYGAGTREIPGLPNVVRAMVFDPRPDTSRGADARGASDAGLDGAGIHDGVCSDTVAVIEFDVDDMTGEEIGVAASRLRALPGTLDVTVGTRIGKKGRPVQDFRLLVATDAAQAVATECFRETSTLGLRWRSEARRVLERSEQDVPAPPHSSVVRVKIAQRPDGARTAKAADEDVANVAGLARRRGLRAASEQTAIADDARDRDDGRADLGNGDRP